MSNKVINARIKNKRDTDSNWQSKNPVLLNGEIILVDMNDGELRAKVGNGTSKYNQLSFSDEILRSLIDNAEDKVGALQDLVGDTAVSDQIESAISGHTHPIDSALSSTSTNPVQNKVVFNAVQALIDGLGNEPVADQIEQAIATKADISDLNAHTSNKNNPHGTTLNTFGVSASAAELNQLVGTKDNVQEQINNLSTLVGDTVVSEQIDEAFDKTITGLSVNGKTITYTKGDGSTGTITTQDTNTTYTNASLGQGYGICETATATAAKDVTLSNYNLAAGGIVSVKFTYAVPASATMNINNKGAKAIYYKGKAIIDGIIDAGEIATFIYDGTRYHLLTVDRNRFFSSLVPYGTQITASETSTVDINTVQFMKVGNYYCSANAQAKYISNLPESGIAFMMQVYAPLSQTVDDESGTWKYRIRKLTHYKGTEYVQYCYSGEDAGVWTYGAWLKVIKSNNTATTSTAGLMSAADKVKLNGIDTGANKITVDSALSSTSTNPVQNKVVNSAISNLSTLIGDEAVSTQIENAIIEHTHNYAGSSSAGGAATSANKLNTNAGGVTQPVYFADGVPKATTYTLGASVPSGAKFTDTIYTHPTTSGNKHIPSGGSSGQILRWSADGSAVWGGESTYDVATTTANGLMSSTDKKTLSNLSTLVGDTSVSTQIANAIANKSDSSHTHDGRYYTETEVNNLLSGKAATSHGNHVPATQTASNKVFLRNDNTWQTVTPANIGAAAASHGTHVSYSTANPVMDGTATAGSASAVARSDHRHPTDTSRAAASELSELQTLVGDTSVATQISSALANVLYKVLTSDTYGSTLPAAGTAGRIFFKKV